MLKLRFNVRAQLRSGITVALLYRYIRYIPSWSVCHVAYTSVQTRCLSPPASVSPEIQTSDISKSTSYPTGVLLYKADPFPRAPTASISQELCQFPSYDVFHRWRHPNTTRTKGVESNPGTTCGSTTRMDARRSSDARGCIHTLLASRVVSANRWKHLIILKLIQWSLQVS